MDETFSIFISLFQVDPDGLSVLAGFADGVIRHLTVVKGSQNTGKTKKSGSAFELKLTQVFKPHVKDVTSLSVSKDGRFLATGVRLFLIMLIFLSFFWVVGSFCKILL